MQFNFLIQLICVYISETFAKETVFMQNTLMGIACYSLCLYVGAMLSFLVLLASTGLSYMIYGFLFLIKWVVISLSIYICVCDWGKGYCKVW